MRTGSASVLGASLHAVAGMCLHWLAWAGVGWPGLTLASLGCLWLVLDGFVWLALARERAREGARERARARERERERADTENETEKQAEQNLSCMADNEKKTTRTNPNSNQNRHNIDPKSSQNRPKWVPKSTRHRPKIGSGADLASETVFGPIWTPFWSQCGANLGPSWGPKSGHAGSRLLKESIY